MKEENIINYIKGIQSYLEYQIGLKDKKELSNNDLIGAKMAFISNVFLCTKEKLIDSTGLDYESKLIDDILEGEVSIIAHVTKEGYRIDGYTFEDAATLVATLRNKIAHGKYEIDFKNNKVELFITPKEHIKVDINILAAFIISGIQTSSKAMKKTEYVRDICTCSLKNLSNRTKAVKTNGELKNIIRNTKNVIFKIKSNDGKHIDKETIVLFEALLKQLKENEYGDSFSRQNINKHFEKFRKMLKNINMELEINYIGVKADDEDKLLKIIKESVNEETYLKQCRLIMSILQRHLNARYNTFTPLVSNLFNLTNMEKIVDPDLIIKNEFSKNINKEAKIDDYLFLQTDAIGMSTIGLFNALFTYSFDNLYKNHNKYTNLDNDGFDYSKLDLNLLDISKVTIDQKPINLLIDKINNTQKEIEETNLKLTTLNDSYNKVKEKNIESAIKAISEVIEEVKLKEIGLKEKLNTLTNDLKELRNYYISENKYLQNMSIIEGIRNSIAHGNYEILLNSNINDTKIIFNDIYEGELTFKAEISITDFIKLLLNSSSIVISFLENKKEDKKVKVK